MGLEHQVQAPSQEHTKADRNHEHRHGGIGLMAPAVVHNGTAAALTEQRAITLDAAFAERARGVEPRQSSDDSTRVGR